MNEQPEPSVSKAPSWKIPVILTDMKVRADNIGGEIKQADANIVAAKRRQAEVREMQRIADAAVIAAEDVARDRRAERDALAAAMHAHVLGLGEAPPPTEAAGSVGSTQAQR